MEQGEKIRTRRKDGNNEEGRGQGKRMRTMRRDENKKEG